MNDLIVVYHFFFILYLFFMMFVSRDHQPAAFTCHVERLIRHAETNVFDYIPSLNHIPEYFIAL